MDHIIARIPPQPSLCPADTNSSQNQSKSGIEVLFLAAESISPSKIYKFTLKVAKVEGVERRLGYIFCLLLSRSCNTDNNEHSSLQRLELNIFPFRLYTLK
jgi:hypothetical protein